jgi:hypothetical protein
MSPDPALHPSTFIEDMIRARDWTREDLAHRMRGDTDTNWRLLDWYADHGPTDPRCRLGITAAELSEVFGLPITFFVRLEALWLMSVRP